MIFVPLTPAPSLARTICATCDGTGETEGAPVCACGCRGRACGFRMVRCPDCGGSGHDESAYEDCCPICNEFESECSCAEEDEAAA